MYVKYLLVSSAISLEYLKDLYLEVNTVSGGQKFFQMQDLYEKTEFVPEQDRDYHFFGLNVSHIIEVKSVTFWRLGEEERAVGKTITFV